MADQTETVELNLDSKELFQGAIAEEPKSETTEEPKSDPEQPRDEHGRFAPKDEAKVEVKAEEVKTEAKVEIKEPPKDETKDDQNGQVPSWRLREVREAREAAERRAEEATRQGYNLQAEIQQMRAELAKLQQPKQEPVDFFANPEQALQQHLTPIEAKFAQLESQVTLNMSRAMALARHGAPAVTDMETAVAKAMQQNNPEMHMLAAQMRESSDPVGVAMQWHKRSKVMELTGGDPDKYRQKILDDALKDPTFRKQVIESVRAEVGGTANPSTIKLPPSLSRATGSGASNEADDGDASDRALFQDAVSRRR